MPEHIKPMTKEDLEKQVALPEVYKKAIEHAIYEMSNPEDPEDKVWPDYFRGEVLVCELGSELHDDDKLDDHEYNTEAGWFQAGWKAREKSLQSERK